MIAVIGHGSEKPRVFARHLGDVVEVGAAAIKWAWAT